MITTIKQPGRRYGPAPRFAASPPRTVEPLDPHQRRFNYIKQPGRIAGPSMILTPRQYRRLTKKSKGTVQRVYVQSSKRLQAFIHPPTGPLMHVRYVTSPDDPLLRNSIA